MVEERDHNPFIHVNIDILITNVQYQVNLFSMQFEYSRILVVLLVVYGVLLFCAIVLYIYTTSGISLLFCAFTLPWCMYQFTIVLCIYTTSGVTLADLRGGGLGTRSTPLWVQILSFSCSFREFF